MKRSFNDYVGNTPQTVAANDKLAIARLQHIKRWSCFVVMIAVSAFVFKVFFFDGREFEILAPESAENMLDFGFALTIAAGVVSSLFFVWSNLEIKDLQVSSPIHRNASST